VQLSTHAFTGDAFDIDICRECGGVWLDRGELERVEQGRVRQILARRAGVRGWLLQFLLQIPVEFNLPPQRFALITLLLLVANVLVMLAVIAAPAPNMLVELGALFPARVGSGQWVVSTITHQFLHAGLAHLALNMVFLWKLGDNVEDALGRPGYLLFYLVCGIAGGLVHTALDWGSPIPMVGASGAISGVMGAYAVLYRRARLTLMVIVLQFKLSAAWWMAIWAAMNVVGFLLGVEGIAWGAHLGGFAVGLVAGWALDRHVLATRPRVRLLRDAAAARPRTPPTVG
jgi:membrane associated rhomboid family serine protease